MLRLRVQLALTLHPLISFIHPWPSSLRLLLKLFPVSSIPLIPLISAFTAIVLADMSDVVVFPRRDATKGAANRVGPPCIILPSAKETRIRETILRRKNEACGLGTQTLP